MYNHYFKKKYLKYDPFRCCYCMPISCRCLKLSGPGAPIVQTQGASIQPINPLTTLSVLALFVHMFPNDCPISKFKNLAFLCHLSISFFQQGDTVISVLGLDKCIALGHVEYILWLTDPDRGFFLLSEGKKSNLLAVVRKFELCSQWSSNCWSYQTCQTFAPLVRF